MKTFFKISLLLLLINLQNIWAQEHKIVLHNKAKSSVIAAIKTHLEESYVDLDNAKKMIAALDTNFKSKKYEKITNPTEFARILTQDLQSISKDLHLKIRFEPERITQENRVISKEMKLEMEKRVTTQMKDINYGFTEVKILEGNIGYLNLRLFADVKDAEETATATMNFLSNTNAIIIDLRTNGGGVPNMVQLLSSYFFDEIPVLLNDFYERKTGIKNQLYTLSAVNGKRSLNKPVYLLTGKQTFSAAEAFTYALKHLGRATVIGQTTQGGANRTKRINLNEAFTIAVPYIKAINLITKTNWEGSGIQPDMTTSEEKAFVYAYISAIHKTAPGNMGILLNKIGYTLLKDQSVDNAIIIFQEAVKLFPDSANAWDSLGEAYSIAKDVENALNAYKKALEIDPTLESAKAMIEKLQSNK